MVAATGTARSPRRAAPPVAAAAAPRPAAVGATRLAVMLACCIRQFCHAVVPRSDAPWQCPAVPGSSGCGPFQFSGFLVHLLFLTARVIDERRVVLGAAVAAVAAGIPGLGLRPAVVAVPAARRT